MLGLVVSNTTGIDYMILQLQESKFKPEWVESATISTQEDRVYLSVKTFHCSESVMCKTVRSAKELFARNFFSGAVWKELA